MKIQVMLSKTCKYTLLILFKKQTECCIENVRMPEIFHQTNIKAFARSLNNQQYAVDQYSWDLFKFLLPVM